MSINWHTPTEADLQTVTGYRTNEDGTQTLAWEVGADGFVTCAHAEEEGCCIPCFEADERLFRRASDGETIARFRPFERVSGRVVTYDRG